MTKTGWSCWVIAIIVCSTIVYAGLMPVLGELQSRNVKRGKSLSPSAFILPFAERPGRLYARSWLYHGKGDQDTAFDYLKSSIKKRPLYAPSLLDMAEMQLRVGNRAEASENIKAAIQLWPNRKVLLWRAAMLWIRLDDIDQMFSTLKQYVQVRPEHFSRAMVIGYRFERDPEKLLENLVPDSSGTGRPLDFYLEKTLRHALSVEDSNLSRFAWSNIDSPQNVNSKLVHRYLESLGERNDTAGYSELLRQLNPEYVPGSIQNGSFEYPVSGYSPGWVLPELPGTNWSLDIHESIKQGSSLKLDFGGADSRPVRYIHQTIPIQSGGHYRLSGLWKKESMDGNLDLSLEILLLGQENRFAGRLQIPPQPGWHKFEIDFNIPESSMIRIQLAGRDADRNSQISDKLTGAVWLDEISLAGPDGVLNDLQ